MEELSEFGKEDLGFTLGIVADVASGIVPELCNRFTHFLESSHTSKTRQTLGFFKYHLTLTKKDIVKRLKENT